MEARTVRRAMRELPLAETGRPAPFRLGAPAYLASLAGWVAAAALLPASADELTNLAVWSAGPVAVAHAIGVVFFPFAVAAAVWQLLPVMLRNNPPRPRMRWLVLALLAAGVPLAASVASERHLLAGVSAAVLGTGLVLLLAELVSLIRRAPRGRTLVVSRPAVALAGAHAAAAFALGAVVLAVGGPEPLGVPYERLLLIHLLLALVGWLTVLIAAVGRILVPMLGLAAVAPRRSAPLAELTIVGGLWLLVAGIAAAVDALLAAGVVAILVGLFAPGRVFLRVARSGTIGVREGPVAHVAVGLLCLLEAAALVLAAATDVISERRATVAAVLLLGIGWAVGVILGHLGKLISLSGWGSWPPGPRPKQAELYPRRAWQVEIVVFAVGVQLLVAGVVADTTALARVGGVLLVAAALTALMCALETVRRVAVSR